MNKTDVIKVNNACAKSLYNEVIDKVKTININSYKKEDIKSWVIGGEADLQMCFVGDACPKEYRDDVMNIIKEVELSYNS